MKKRLYLDEIHYKDYFSKHCEIIKYLLDRNDSEHPSVKHHIRSAIREASNHVTPYKSNEAKAGAIYMSQEAYIQMKSGDFSNLIGEHVVPVSILTEFISTPNNISLEEIKEVLLSFGMRAVITKREDYLLKRNGLQKHMPENWNKKNPCARYDYLNIDLVYPNKYMELQKNNS